MISTARKPENIDWDESEYGAGIVNAQELLGKKPEGARKKAEEEYSKFKDTKKEDVDSGLNDIKNTYYSIMKK